MVLRFILAAIALFVLFKGLMKAIQLWRWYREIQRKTVSRSGERVSEMVRDPVCGVYISGDQALSVVKDGRRFHFCSPECQQKFLKQQV